MNLCIVSIFDVITEDYMEMFNATKEKTKDFMVDHHIGIIREGKLMVMIQITDMEKMQEIMSSDEMKAWDENFNCVDEVYSLEKMN